MPELENVLRHFEPLLSLLDTVAATKDYDNPAIVEAVAAGVRGARVDGILPEQIIAFLRRRLHATPLSAVGDWYRGVLVERMIDHAISAFFDLPPLDIRPKTAVRSEKDARC